MSVKQVKILYEKFMEEVSVYEGAEGDEKADKQDAVQEEVMNNLKDIPDSFWSPWLDENTQSSQKVYKLKLNKISCEKCAKSFSRSWLKKHRCKPIRQTTYTSNRQRERLFCNYKYVRM